MSEIEIQNDAEERVARVSTAAAARLAEPLRFGPLPVECRVLPAPMCGISDRATRQMARDMGCSLTYTQMFSSEGITRGDDKTFSMIDTDGEETEGRFAIQLFGSNPQRLGDAARAMQDRGASLVDLNMGCPAKKVTGNKCGSALMREPELVREIARAMRAGCSRVAFTVKMRAGWDKNLKNMTEIARIAEGEGADAVCLHPRTKEERFSGHSDWDLIGELKAALTIPVIGNGDVQCGADALRMMNETGCDAVMIGRGWLGRPWALRDCVDVLRRATADRAELPPSLDRYDPGTIVALGERLALLRRHAELMVRWKGEERGMVELRKHGVQYVKGLRHASRFKDGFLRLKTLVELDRLIADVLAENAAEPVDL